MYPGNEIDDFISPVDVENVMNILGVKQASWLNLIVEPLKQGGPHFTKQDNRRFTEVFDLDQLPGIEQL